jgi:hypothetical protein
MFFALQRLAPPARGAAFALKQGSRSASFAIKQRSAVTPDGAQAAKR